LRSWEDRYGFPRPRRPAGGHRRYDPDDVALIEAVLRLRASGMSLSAAVSQVASRTAQAELSVFAGLRRRHPALIPQVLRKVTLLALTRAIEDECCAAAERPVLFASFQQQRFFRQSQDRWNELARTARAVVVFADFGTLAAAEIPPPDEPAPVRVPLPADAPARREWTLVCGSGDYPACVTGWEFPGQREGADAARRFEVIWSVDPQVVGSAAAICAQLARLYRPGLGRLLASLPPQSPPPASADLRRAAGLLTRMTGYLEQAVGPAHRRPLQTQRASRAPDYEWLRLACARFAVFHLASAVDGGDCHSLSTQSFVRAWMTCWLGSRYRPIVESYAPGMATKYKYLCKERPGHDTDITDHMNSRAAEGWELVAAQIYA
jgi:DICT domain-containing protein